MPSLAPKAREDLQYFDREIDGDDVVLVRDPIRNTYFRYNALQAAMLQALDGHRTVAEITADLSEQFEVEIPPEAAERFISRARELMLLEVTAYEETSAAAREQVRKALRKAGFRTGVPHPRAPVSALPSDLPTAPSTETALLAAAFHELELDHPRSAAGYLAEILRHNPDNARARQLYDLIQTAFIRSTGAMTDFPTWKMFNPSRLLTWLSHTIGWFVFSWMGVLAILVFVAIGAYAYVNVPFEHVATGPLDIAIAVVVATIAGLLHELGHGLACQHYGGNVTEIGFTLFYYVQPAAYCDTSSSYTITRRRHKVIIQLAGIVVSALFMSALSMLLVVLDPGLPIYPGLALMLVVTSLLVFATLIPFVKFDGYYAVCDYFGFPNLRDRSFKLARAWLSKWILGIELATEELAPRTRRLLITYAILAFAFTTWFIYFGFSRVLVPIVAPYRGAGAVFAVAISTYLARNVTLRPMWSLARLLVRERRRVVTRRRIAALAVVALALAGPWFLRWPVLTDAEFVVVPEQRADIRALTAGRVDQIFVHEGDRVRSGQPLATLRNAALRAQIAGLEADREVASRRLEQLRNGARAEELALARRRLERARSEVRRATRDAELATRLAEASLGTEASADTALDRVAVSIGAAGAARWGLSLLAAGARREQVAAAEAEVARIESQLVHLRAEQELLTLRSPIDGIVVTAHLEDKLQARLAPGDRFAEVHGLGAVVAEIALPESDPLGEIAIGDEVALRPYGAPRDDVRARVVRVRDAAQDSSSGRRIVVVTSPFALDRPISGLTGHARIYGADHSLAYANLYLPLQRLVGIQAWSMWR
ncbi:MAG TPA: PqqD family peptide modification chaperone [Kofleriaceae bacterium]|nr:PqqD family peptide modification chaperone [Kofleriaceae bacterium]